MTRSRYQTASWHWQLMLLAVLIGALPGVLLVLGAEYLVDGEPQLTVGVAGMWLAAAGAVAGFLLWLRHARKAARGD